MRSAEIKNYVQQFSARIANYVITAAATATGLKDGVEGRATGPGEPRYGLSVRRLWPFGLRSVPPAGCEGVILRINAGRRSLVLIAAESQKYGPKDLKSGETAVYDAKGSIIRLNEDGSVLITSKSGATVELAKDGSVVLQGGTKAVARDQDPVAPTVPFSLYLNALSVATNVPAFTGNIGLVNGGNPKVKA